MTERPRRQTEPTVLVVGPLAAPADVRRLSAAVRRRLACPDPARPRCVVLDVTALGRADCLAVGALARTALAARRCDARVRLRGATRELVELVALCGLARVLPSGAEPVGQAEQREEASRVEEEGDARDPVA